MCAEILNNFNLHCSFLFSNLQTNDYVKRPDIVKHVFVQLPEGLRVLTSGEGRGEHICLLSGSSRAKIAGSSLDEQKSITICQETAPLKKLLYYNGLLILFIFPMGITFGFQRGITLIVLTLL